MGSERTVRESWRRHIVELLDQALEQNDAAISGVAAAISTTILAGRHVYAFGAGHSLALVSEMHRRAGGMKVGAAAVERRTHLAGRRGGRREAGEPAGLLQGAHRRAWTGGLAICAG